MERELLDKQWNGPVTKTESCTFEGRIKAETDKAIMFVIYLSDDPNDIQSEWFPLSQVVSIHKTFSVVNNTLDKIVVKQWIAKQKGLV